MVSQLLADWQVAVQFKTRIQLASCEWVSSVFCRTDRFVSLHNALTTFSVPSLHPVDVGLCSAGKGCSVGYYRLTAGCWY